jgi:hypothetical protein
MPFFDDDCRIQVLRGGDCYAQVICEVRLQDPPTKVGGVAGL